MTSCLSFGNFIEQVIYYVQIEEGIDGFKVMGLGLKSA